MPGERCWLGAGCFNLEGRVMTRFWGLTRQGDISGHHGRIPWTAGKTNRILNREDPMTTRHEALDQPF